MEFQVTLFAYNNDTPLEVSFEYEPYVRAKISGPPEDCYPEEGGEANIFSVSVGGSKHDIQDLLSEKVMSDLQEQCETYGRENQDDRDDF